MPYRGLLIFSRFFCALAVVAVLAGPSSGFELFGVKFLERSDDPVIAEDALPYAAHLQVSGGEKSLPRILKSASMLVSSQSNPPSGTVGLVARARQDRRNLVGVLYREGYYAAVVDIHIDGRPLDQLSVTQRLDPPVDVLIGVESGPLFRFGAILITGSRDVDTRSRAEENGLVSGMPAGSDAIFKTETALLKDLGERGHPFPRIVGREITADHSRTVLDIAIRVDSGPVARFGPVRIEGAKTVDPDHIVFIADIPTGAPYSSKVLSHSKSRLSKIEALGSVSIIPAEPVRSDGSVPIVIKVSERKPRVIGVGANWSSTDGLNVRGYWKHRNVFGRGELFRIDIGLGRLTQYADLQQIDANLGILLSQPGFFGPATRLDLGINTIQEHPDAYRRRAVLGTAAIAYQHSPELELTGGVVGEYSEVEDAFGKQDYGLISVPLAANYDNRDDKMDPSRGVHVRGFIEPTADLRNGTSFLKLDSSLASYRALDRNRRYILAGRLRAGIIFGAKPTDIPADKRFLSGGGGSVRGYTYKNIGAGRLGGDAIAGRARFEGSAEMRTRWTESIGSVIFADAGYVDDDASFAAGDFKLGVGAGLRYFTPVGPIRLDVAIPLDPDKGDPDFAVYLGIGQAF